MKAALFVGFRGPRAVSVAVLVILALMTTAFLAGCGGGNDTSEEDSGQPLVDQAKSLVGGAGAGASGAQTPAQGGQSDGVPGAQTPAQGDQSGDASLATGNGPQPASEAPAGDFGGWDSGGISIDVPEPPSP